METISIKQSQPLSRNFEQRITQLAVITEKPTPQQIQKFADYIVSNHPEDPEISTQRAISSFENMGSLIRDKQFADQTVEQARIAALSAPRDEFEERLMHLRELEKWRAEMVSSLITLSKDFRDAGIELDPSQIPVSLGERVSQKAQQIGTKVATGASMAQGSIKEVAGYVAGQVGSKIEAGKRLTEPGRESISKLFGELTHTLNQAQETGQSGFNNAKSIAEASSGREMSGVSKLGEMWRKAKEGISQKTGDVWEGASVWANQRRAEVINTVMTTPENVDQMLTKARHSAAARINEFNQTMQSVGEAARDRWGEATEPVPEDFVLEQTARVDNTKTEVNERVGSEVSAYVEIGKIYLELTWQGLQKDSQRIKQEVDVYGEMLGWVVEGVSDVASPIIDRILDEGRDLRDAALGFGTKQIQGLRVFGRNAAGGAVEAGSPAWNFLAERWENLRLRANESRPRLNTFMEAVSDQTGNRFSMPKESTSERAKRTSSMLAGIKIEGGKILQNGIEVSRETAEWFVQSGTTAKEFLMKEKEQIRQGIFMLQRYWEVYAVGKWTESGLADIDIKRRMKLLRATGAASLGRAAAIGAAAGFEGAMMLQSLARDRRSQVALTVIALGLALAVNPELRDGIQILLSHVDLSGMHAAATGGMHMHGLGSHLAGIDTSSLHVPHPGGMPSQTPDVSGAAVSVPTPDTSQGGMFSHMDVSAAVPTPTPDIHQGIPTHTLNVTPALHTASPHVTGTASGSELAGSLPNPDVFIPGQPLSEQARKLAGGVNENYYHLLQAAFNQFHGNFESTARVIVNHPANYSPEQISIARQQLEAVARLNQDPTLIEGSQRWYDTIMKATHFWSPE